MATKLSYAGHDIIRRMYILIEQIVDDANNIGYTKESVLGMVKDEYTKRNKREKLVQTVLGKKQNASN